MRIAALVHFYVPFRNAGSETMLHTLLKALQLAGHQIEVYATDIPDAPPRYQYEGIDILSVNTTMARKMLTEDPPDLMVTHHFRTRNTAVIAKSLRIPFVFLMHNDFKENRRYLSLRPDLVVFNTKWIQEGSNYPGSSMVVHPPVIAEDHRADPGSRVTLVNLNAHKGGEIFYRLAQEMPDVQFLGVEGGHGEQILRYDLPNVRLVRHTSNMPEQVWSRTKILLMPSNYESYGMAGVEALASGIPVIATPTLGLRESLGSAGVFVPREDEEGLRREIRRLLDPTEWAAASERALARSRELDPAIELNAWVTRIEEMTL